MKVNKLYFTTLLFLLSIQQYQTSEENTSIWKKLCNGCCAKKIESNIVRKATENEVNEQQQLPRSFEQLQRDEEARRNVDRELQALKTENDQLQRDEEDVDRELRAVNEKIHEELQAVNEKIQADKEELQSVRSKIDELQRQDNARRNAEEFRREEQADQIRRVEEARRNAGQELQAVNEKIQAHNEELQAVSEKIQADNEEVQAVTSETDELRRQDDERRIRNAEEFRAKVEVDQQEKSKSLLREKLNNYLQKQNIRMFSNGSTIKNHKK